MIIVLGTVVVREGKLAEALALSLEHVARSRQEPGCIAHGVHQDAENSSRLVFVEQWADRKALLDHFAVPASRAFAASLSALADGRPSIDMFDATRVQVPDLQTP